MKLLFLDESGECSFSSESIYKHFVITVVSIDSSEAKQLKNRLKKEFASFIKKGWNRDVEIKAYELYKNRKFGPDAVSGVINALLRISSLEVNYIVVNKKAITNQSFRDAPYGTAYNYFTKILLSEIIFEDELHDVSLVYDKKNKETHENRHFREYVDTAILGTALERDVVINLHVEGGDSSKRYGLLASDYFSWALFRKFEYGDRRFFSLFQHKIKRKKEWYLKK